MKFDFGGTVSTTAILTKPQKLSSWRLECNYSIRRMSSQMGLAVQSVPEKMRLEMVNEMQIEILNGGEILVNCKFKLQKISI